jgi:HlyD family secretion protein
LTDFTKKTKSKFNMTTPNQPIKKKRTRLYWIIGIAAIVLLIGLAMASGGSKNKGEKVAIEKVAARSIVQTVSASGRIFPAKEIKISSDVSGQIVELRVKEGDSVKAGQFLARINPEIYKDQVTRGEAGVNASKAQYANSQAQIESVRARRVQAAAQIEQLEAQLVNTRSAFKRNEKLHTEGVISDAEFETSQSQLRAQEANLKQLQATLQGSVSDLSATEQSARASEFQVKSSEASLSELRKSLNKTEIYAPADGVVSKLNVEKGERVVGTAQMSGTEMMRIANLAAMEVQVNIAENDILRVAVGNDVDIDVDAYTGRKFKGVVTEIANTAANATTATGALNLTTDQVTNFVVKIRIDPASYTDLVKGGRAAFRPGMSASVDIRTNKVDNVISVPISAVTTREAEEKKLSKEKKEGMPQKESKTPDKVVVFIASKDTVRMVEVKTGLQDDRYIQITDGIKAGEEVIALPFNLIAKKLKSGTKITVVPEKELYGGDKKR